MEKINIKSCFISRFGRRASDYTTITLEALRSILSSNDPERVMRIHMASYAATELCDISDPLEVVRQAIQSDFPGLRSTYHGMFRTGGEALFQALVAMAQSPTHGDILVVGSEKMTHLQPAVASGLLSGRENRHHRQYGATLPALGALVTRAYLQEYDVPAQALDWVAMKNHLHGSRNPKAHFRREVTVDEIEASPLVADPLRRYHCAPMSDGAAAVLLSHDVGAVRCIGFGKGLDVPLFQERKNLARFVATARASDAACAQAHVARQDIDIVEIHDAFSSFELINLEEMGFYPIGQAWRPLQAGDLNINGKLAVNSSGGMKAKGHPIGATGLSSCTELFEQLTGSAGARQHEGARLGMIQSAGGVSNESYVFILEAS